jgi:hypothetical protein
MRRKIDDETVKLADSLARYTRWKEFLRGTFENQKWVPFIWEKSFKFKLSNGGGVRLSKRYRGFRELWD